MAYDWRVGDKAVCVKSDTGWHKSISKRVFDGPKNKEIVTISKVNLMKDANLSLVPALHFNEYPGCGGYMAQFFRPVVPAPEKAEDEFIVLMQSFKPRVEV